MIDENNITASILVVDDEAANINLLRKILHNDYGIITATNGNDALNVAERDNPDLILLDINMPGMNGFEVCEKLKENSLTRHIPVIFVTAFTDIESEKRGFGVGAVDYITKPYSALLVKARVRNQITLKKYQDTLEERVMNATAELRMEREKLRKSEQLYRSLMESAPDAVLLVNEEGVIELVNKAATKAFLYEVDELIGQKIELLVPLANRNTHQHFRTEFLKRPCLRDSSVPMQGFLARKKDGMEFPVNISLSPVETEKGISIIADVRDNTEQEQMQKQLRQAQKMEAIGHLTGGIAHDFNNILNSILGFTQLSINMLGDIRPEKLEEYLNIVYTSGERARDLVAQMLAFSRGNYGGDFMPLSLSSLVKETIKMLRPIMPSSIDIELDIDDNVPNVVADPVQINQVIMNLCINARDAMHENGTLHLSLKNFSVSSEICASCQEVVNGNYLAISVSDTGTGIEDNNLIHIFNPFFSTKEVGKGTGMGLSVAHGIVHGHDGHILMKSIKGEGTTFDLLFPVADEQALPSIDSDDRQLIDISGDNRHVLVVDDDEHIGLFIESLLSEFGFKISLYTSSQEALAFFQQHHDEIDLVITDQTMPKLTGYDMSKAMLEIQNDMPIIMATGHSEIVDADSARSLGIKYFLNKPVKTHELLSSIKDIFNL